MEVTGSCRDLRKVLLLGPGLSSLVTMSPKDRKGKPPADNFGQRERWSDFLEV